MTMIKFCGIRRQEDVDYVNEVKPDLVGFVFWPKSKRCITIEQAVELADRIPDEIGTVGVFLDATLEEIIEVASTGAIDYIQLHGNESDRYIYMIKTYTGLPVIKAFVIKSQEDIEKALNSMADYIMLDSGPGTGETFDWSVLGDLGRPYFLAGGLNPTNVGGAIAKLQPMGVDTSSGIETDGCKDLEKMKAFKEEVIKASETI
ncbi:MAG: phosphoribosylanthranilate isomerase [archaeon]|nr:phosphoribosylanthranilate isomerase [archaeon]